MWSAILVIAAAVTSPLAFHNPVSLDVPEPLLASIQRAERSLEIASCTSTPEQLAMLEDDEEYDGRGERFDEALFRAQALWGDQVRDLALNYGSDVSCDNISAEAALQAVDAALDEQDQLYRQATAPMGKGVWVGPLKLCRTTVTSVAPGVDYRDESIVSVTLTRDAAVAFGQITTRSVNYPLPIRVGGEIISSPNVNEPILGGSFQINDQDGTTLERVQMAMGEDC